MNTLMMGLQTDTPNFTFTVINLEAREIAEWLKASLHYRVLIPSVPW